ncbi:dimethylaniline monooxygenase [N-oxide-forming] 4 isoform X1 [Thamnophis elegans]|uniref:dimethylaniline monooxygenase [N-oxide-forming] 4 isoform X1 n=2 Tax=Thamnophis elegans TaxID=35005 RepID=UPI001378C174|nr:dimethylaniline monooxygenase [N-oxide-forming] 4 isoform X1 [Thamnophis elegans]XP_032081989.1 dimethylaniline monooxygenase [N-oxide-forming] 4 isoform X1 [Thamnophis elegans]
MGRKVAIIGAGVSGLASIKCCLEEGLEPTCFEKNDVIGGLWQFTDIPEKGRTNVYRSVVSNTSKEMTCFSDFPFPESCPNYLHHSLVLEYLKDYAKHFHLLDCIQFKTTVYSIREHPDFTTTGQWVVYTEANGKKASTVFDAVMICSGNFTEVNLPLDSFPGFENFKGHYIHSREYRDPKGLEGKNVLILGAGNTGGDVAVEVSRIAAKVFLSTRNGAWVLSRMSKAGWPSDMVFQTRFLSFIQGLLPVRVRDKLLAKKFNQWFNHENYGLLPIKSSLTYVIINDELPSCILCGSVVVKPNVKRFTETSAIFEDGTVEENIDVVIFTTGYAPSFLFLEESVRNVCKSSTFLYKQVFPPHLQKLTLAFIGFISVTGSILPAVELQARWVTRVFNGFNKLPPMNRMMHEVAKQKKRLLKKGTSNTEKEKELFVRYMDEIAACIGVKPNVSLLLLQDPKLALKVFFGPCTSYQYRLCGPGKWEKARNTILTQWDRILKPLKTRIIDNSSKHFKPSLWKKIFHFTALLGTTILMFTYVGTHFILAKENT